MRLKPGNLALLACVCAISAAAQAPTPTFSNEVVRIFQQNCQTCHHPGDIAPFSLMDYQSARPYALSIKAAVQSGKMPPWKPVAGYGEFRDARRLTPEQIDTLVRWADAGAPEGDRAQLPPPLAFPDGWSLGQPDLVLSTNQFSVPAESGDIYRCFSIPVNIPADRYVSAIDVRPGNRSVVHHVLGFGDHSQVSAGLDARDAGEGYSCFGGPGFTPDDDFFAGWAPGMRAVVFDPGLGIVLHPNSRVAIQVHYHPDGRAETDTTQIGIYFSRTPVDKIVRVLPLLNTTFVLPAGAPRTRVAASFTVPPLSLLNTHIVGVAPHMHLLGREINVEKRTSGVTTPLIYINNWDFEWQSVYFYRQPVPLPGGSTVSFEAFYDNSENNPRNPNSPPRDVRWGEETTDEMALVFFLYTTDSEHLAPPQATSAGLVNAASFTVGAIAPGAIASLFGSGFSSGYEAASSLPLPRQLAGGTRVTVGGVEAPLFYVSPSQINFQVPYEVPAGTAEVRIIRAGDNAAQSFQITVGSASPGIFAVNGAAAALNARTGTLVTPAAPAQRGEFVSLFASGLGAVSPLVQSGSAPAGVVSTSSPVTVMVGNTRAEVSFAGLAPNFAGLYQVNFRIPADAPAGDAVPIKIMMAGAESNAAMLAVR